MRYFTLFPLQGYWGKFAGVAISAIALSGFAIHELAGPDILPLDLPPGKLVVSSLWLFALGLFMLSFSKEKIDDERVQKIRYVSLRGTGMIVFLMLFCTFSPLVIDANGISDPAINDPVAMVCLVLVLPLLVYQVIFNVGLHLNPAWASNDLGAEENIRKNPKFFLIYILLIVILFIISIATKTFI